MHTRGYLPHVKREGASYFVTFRLADSLPKVVLMRYQQERGEALQKLPANATQEMVAEINRIFRWKIEAHLDRGQGGCFLQQPDVAKMIVEALLFFDEKQYLLSEWVIMPNHVHLVLWPMPNFTLSMILRSRKRFTARQANLLLGRTGTTFWQRESYDHWIRDDAEKCRIRRYVRMNAVKAGLCHAPEDWQWSSAWPGWTRTRDEHKDK